MSKVIEKSRSDNYKIIVKNVQKFYDVKSESGEKSEKFLALDNFNLKIKKGEFITIVGPSGCGKSTFLDILAGLSKPTSGELYIDDKLIEGPDLDRGIIFQGYALFPWRTVEQNIEFGLEIKGIPKNERKEISNKFIKLVGLSNFENRYPHELSGGMKQRVAIVIAALGLFVDIIIKFVESKLIGNKNEEVFNGINLSI